MCTQCSHTIIYAPIKYRSPPAPWAALGHDHRWRLSHWECNICPPHPSGSSLCVCVCVCVCAHVCVYVCVVCVVCVCVCVCSCVCACACECIYVCGVNENGSVICRCVKIGQREYTVVMKKFWGYKEGEHIFILLEIYSISR